MYKFSQSESSPTMERRELITVYRSNTANRSNESERVNSKFLGDFNPKVG